MTIRNYDSLPDAVRLPVEELICADTPVWPGRATFKTTPNSETGNRDISYQRFDSTERGTVFAGITGLAMTTVSGVDVLGTRSAMGNYNVEQIREHAQVRIEPFARKFGDVIEQGAEEISICTFGGEVCGEYRTFDTTTHEGLSDYLRVEIEESYILTKSDKEAIERSLNTDQVSRTPESDEAQVEEIETVVAQHVASYPDMEPPSTNTNTGELLIAGPLLAAGAVIAGIKHRRRQNRLRDRFDTAVAAVKAVDVKQDVENMADIGYAKDVLKAALRHTGNPRPSYLTDIEVPPQPTGGGLLRRDQLRKSIANNEYAAPR